MKANFDEMLEKMADFMKTEAKTETIVGKSFKLGQFECVPVIRLGFGIGGGEGGGMFMSNSGEALGLGSGIIMEAAGFLVCKDDQIQFVAAHQRGGLSMAIEKLPELFGQYFDHKKDNKKKKIEHG